MREAENLIRRAQEARARAYAPYSRFCVGAALLDSCGNTYTGCNVENAAYPATCCAERTAFFKAVSEGVQEFKAIAIVGGTQGEAPLEYCAPCGVCRQVMREFCESDFRVILAKSETQYQVLTLGELLPWSFGPDNLKENKKEEKDHDRP